MRSRRPADRPRIGVDASSLSIRGKGVARYLYELLPRLAQVDAPIEIVVLADSAASLPPGAEHLARRRIRPHPASVWEQFGMPRAARAAGLSLLHSTSDRLPIAGVRIPLVLYLFEDPARREALVRDRTLREHTAGILTRSLFPISLRRAALTLVSSASTARDLAARNVPVERVRITYPGVSESFRPVRDESELRAIRLRLSCPDGYVLHFSSDDLRDNTPVALAAYAEVAGGEPKHPPLIVAGPVRRELRKQRELARALGIDNRVRWIGYQAGTALAELYRGASAYLDPSIFEGFGFQVLEALASGVPVICSATTSLPEVAGNAALLAAPEDTAAFGSHLLSVLTHPDLGTALGRRGVRQAARFSWKATAETTVSAWLEVLARRA